MKQYFKCIITILTISLITVTKADMSRNLEFLSDTYTLPSLSTIENKLGEIIEMTPQLFGSFETDKILSLSKECKEEIFSLSSVIKTVLESPGVDEKIFYATKDLVNHFPGLNKNCSIPLPTIDTSKWDFEKFKKYHCALEVVSFATSATKCISGAYLTCVEALRSLVTIGKCLKDFVDN